MDMESFVAGLRVLAVDDDRVCLKILETQLRHCKYNVTAVTRAEAALELLRARKDGDQFDLVISDVHMPDMDGFKLLELVGLEMNIPVIMLSANEEMETMMKGIKHGACDYLLKPVHLDRLKNIWLHVVKKSKDDPRDHISDAPDDASEKYQSRDAEDEMNGADDTKKHSRKNKKDGDGPEEDCENASTQKRQRIQWSADLHRKFVEAVHQIGFDRAVPKKILETMNVNGITREHVASHLQKYRLALKRLSLSTHRQSNPYPAETESSRRDWNYIKMNGLDSSPSALRMDYLPYSRSVQPMSSQRNMGIPLRDMGLAGQSGNLLNAAVHDVRNVTSSGNSYGNISNGDLLSGSNPLGSHIENIPNCMVLAAKGSFPNIISGGSIANISNGSQPLAPGLINSWKAEMLSMFPGCRPSQESSLKINQLSMLASSTSQMTATGNEFQKQMAALMGKSTPVVDFSEQMAPFNLESNPNSTSVLINNSALASASSIRPTLPEIQLENSDMPIQMLNGGGESVDVPVEKDGSRVDQHDVGDLMGTSGGLDDFFVDWLNRVSPNGHAGNCK